MLIANIALRQQPPQRVLFGAAQDSTGRQTRGSANHNSPTPGSTGVNGTYGANGAAFTIANYEPRVNQAATMKPVHTPASNPEHYRSMARKMLAARKSAHGYLQPRGPMMLPGSKYAVCYHLGRC
jgi:chromatin structure-remodeling complex subunit RSC9